MLLAGNAGSKKYALHMLQPLPSETDLVNHPEGVKSEEPSNREQRVAENLWKFASEKSTLHALILRQIVEAHRGGDVSSSTIESKNSSEQLDPDSIQAGQ